MDKIFKLLHIHIHINPIVSRYISFNTRDIIYECRCGDRCKRRVYRAYGDAFPIFTGSLNSKQFNEVLNNEESETTKVMMEIDERVNNSVSYS